MCIRIFCKPPIQAHLKLKKNINCCQDRAFGSSGTTLFKVSLPSFKVCPRGPELLYNHDKDFAGVSFNRARRPSAGSELADRQ